MARVLSGHFKTYLAALEKMEAPVAGWHSRQNVKQQTHWHSWLHVHAGCITTNANRRQAVCLAVLHPCLEVGGMA